MPITDKFIADISKQLNDNGYYFYLLCHFNCDVPDKVSVSYRLSSPKDDDTNKFQTNVNLIFDTIVRFFGDIMNKDKFEMVIIDKETLVKNIHSNICYFVPLYIETNIESDMYLKLVIGTQYTLHFNNDSQPIIIKEINNLILIT